MAIRHAQMTFRYAQMTFLLQFFLYFSCVCQKKAVTLHEFWQMEDNGKKKKAVNGR